MIDYPDFRHEDLFSGIVAGVDEAGRGPLAGPVVAAAVILDPENIPGGLADSKALTEKRREAIAPEIFQRAKVGVGVASVEEIDDINILWATMLAMKRAAEALPAKPDVCLIDGNRAPDLSCATQTIVKGDARSLSIAAASIIAKTTRDKIMRDLAKEFPQFSWEKNKGYGARAHMDALKKFGPTQHHRKSFAPVHNMLCADSSLRRAG